MDQQTTPETGVEQASPEDRVLAILDRQPEVPEAEEPEQEAAAEQPQDQGEPSADDIPEEEAQQPAVDTLEITHNGQKRTLTRDEAVSLAQQGFDYTQKMQRLSDESRQVTAMLSRAQEIEQFEAQIAPERAQVAAIEGQLRNYQNVDWVALATNDPLEYPKYQAQYQTLLNAYQQARGQLDQKVNTVRHARQELSARMAQQEVPKLLERIPEWTNPEKRQQGMTALRSFLAREGYGEEEINGIADSRLVSTAYKAWKYDQLVAAKADKVKQLRTAPPVIKPGASQASSARAEKDRALRERLGKTKSRDDAVELYLNRMK